MSINTVTLTGRAGRDPEIKYFESGTMVAGLSIAIDKFKKDEKADFFEIKFWGKQAQVAADYLRKGALFGVTGRLEWETWTDRNTGEERKKPVIVGERLQLLGSKRDTESAPSNEDVPF
jgi:single-strand DNA-binding protein